MRPIVVPFLPSRARNGRDGERVRVGVGILKGESVPVGQGLAIVNEAVVVAEALEDPRVDETVGAEPATVEVDARDVAPGHASVHDLHSIGGYATGERGRRSLAYHYIGLAASLPPHPVRFFHCRCCIKQTQNKAKKVVTVKTKRTHLPTKIAFQRRNAGIIIMK